MAELSASMLSDQSAAIVENSTGRGGVVLICEHAGQQIPRTISSIGLDDGILSTHIAWDIGAAGLARALSKLLDAPLVLQRYSRLVFDCNRGPEAEDAIIERGDGMMISMNTNLSQLDHQYRYETVYLPFFEAVNAVIEDCIESGQQPAIVTIHSFTPILNGRKRNLDLGVLHDSDHRFADRILSQTEQTDDYNARRNEPYAPQDGVTHTLIMHGIKRKLPNVMFEVRNDLIGDLDAQGQWAQRLGGLLSGALNSEPGSVEV
jgi:predicted N-formylglutamate amidohydrolase